MKNLWIGLLLVLCAFPVYAEEPIEIEVVASPTHGLYYMVECLVDTPHRSPQMATSFSSRIGNWSPVAEALEDWKKQVNSPELSRLRFPESRRLGEVLEMVALQSKDVEDLASRAGPWLGPVASDKFRQVLFEVQPHYQQYWWPGSDLGGRRTELLEALKRGDFEANFEKASKFYRGRLQESKATVALVPHWRDIGEEKTLTRGHNSGSLQVFEVVVDCKKPGMAGVCFHEFLHGIWKGQDAVEAARWKSHFEARGLWGRLAYVQLNEGLATALGNGWFQSLVSGQLDQGSWYNDPVIDKYAHALFPIVKVAVESGRPPTDSELDAMLEAFSRAVPDADKNFDVVAARFLTVTTRPEAHLNEYQDGLMRLGPLRQSGVKDAPPEPGHSSTFRLFWPAANEMIKGWPNKDFALRQTEQGWEMLFRGDQQALFKKLRELQVGGLRSVP